MARTGTLTDLKTLNSETALIVSPSDTTYGFHTRSLTSLQKIKDRPGNFIYLVDGIPMAETLVEIPKETKKVLESCWPGPITFVLRSKADPNQTVAIRWPKDNFCMAMIQAFQGPVLSTSCNLPGKETVTTVDDAKSLFGDNVDLYIDGGRRVGMKPSTLVDLTVTPPKVLRQGQIVFTPKENHK